jgi:signal peptidase I
LVVEFYFSGVFNLMKNNSIFTDDDHAATRAELKAEVKRSETRGWIISMTIAVTIAVLLRLFVFEFVSISQTSMEPTLYSNNCVFMERVTYWFAKPEFGDVVICEFPNSGATYVKRVIGVQGDTLEIKDGVLTINGQPDKTYFSDDMTCTLPSTVVPEGCVYVMGDNRNVSVDSRSVGPLKLSMIMGKALFVIWPLDQMHGL